MSLNVETCSLGIFACIIFYCVSKLLTYLFLRTSPLPTHFYAYTNTPCPVEKVYIVWPSKRGRWASIPYRIGFCAVLGFVVVLIMMIVGRIAYLTDDRRCIIGLQKASSMTTLFVDLFVNILLTCLFLWPLWRSKLLSPNIRRVASRTLVASFAALAISATNLAILTIVHGQELGWVCLASCSTDVVVNAMVLFWLTRPGQSGSDEPSGHGTHGHHNNRSEGGNAKTNANANANNGGGVVQLNRMSNAPGGYGSSSFNGTSRPSTGLRSQTDLEGHTLSPPRSPMKVNFGGVYDGSQPFVRESPLAFPDDKPFKLDKPPAAAMAAQHPSFFTDKKRHSSGIVYEKTVSTASPNDGSASNGGGGGGFFNKFMRRSNPSGDAVGSVSVPNLMGFGTRSKRESKEDAGVRITITTRLEQDDESLRYDASEGGRSKEDQYRV